jgi:hypothetical protein
MRAMSVRERVRRCMGSAYSEKHVYPRVPAAVQRDIDAGKNYTNYKNDLLAILALYNATNPESGPCTLDGLLYLFGDISHNCRVCVLTKSRPAARLASQLASQRNVLLNIDRKRHWGELATVDRLDVPWEAKADALVWRGSTTGVWDEAVDRGRRALAARYARHADPGIDVGVCAGGIIQRVAEPRFRGMYEWMVKDRKSVADQLRYRYIVSVEGNDVSSNLKWALYSNATVLMAAPRMESWALETALVPGVHYVRVKDDYSDLEDRLRWCRENPAKAKRIAAQGRAYIRPFLDERREAEISTEIIRRFRRNVRVLGF